jgi:hypothetical protein
VAYGGGWVLGATFEMTPGTPEKEPVAVVPIWDWVTTGKEPTQIVYGDPTQPISASLPTQMVQLPAGARSFGVRSTITGHGQGNLDNCSEFCSEEHTWQVGATPNQATVWRTDCANFPSEGTYQYARAGWCPGASVIPWDFDVTSQVADAGATVPVSYGVTPYMNSCSGTVCSGCASGESCMYNGSDHTQPFYYVQSLLIGFRNSPADAGSVCVPGQSVQCAGPGGCLGDQACNAQGSGYLVCDCGMVTDAGLDSDSSGSEGGSDSGWVTDSGPSDGATADDAPDLADAG